MTSSIGSPSTALVAYSPPRTLQAIVNTHRQRVSQLFMHHSFRMQFADYKHFHRNWRGHIIVLAGTSTAGKTSIVKALQHIEPERMEDGGDLTCTRRILGDFKKHCPQETAFLESVIEPLNIPAAVLSKEHQWKRGVSESQKREAESCIQQIKDTIDALSDEERAAPFQNLDLDLFNTAFEHSARGTSVIIDALQVDELFQATRVRGFDGPMTVALIYCPFHALSARMEKRNQEAVASGNLGNRRIGTFPLLQFSEVYTQKPSEQPTLEVVTRTQAIDAFNENFNKEMAAAQLEGRPETENQQILMGKDASLQWFLDKLGFQEGVTQVEIAPRRPEFYHLLLNSHRLSATTSAQILHAVTK